MNSRLKNDNSKTNQWPKIFKDEYLNKEDLF